MKFLSKSILVLGAVAMIACGDKKEEKEDKITIGDGASPQSQTTTKSSESGTSADEDVVEVTIEGNDQMRFNKDEIRVKAGKTVRLTLKHVGEMEKSVMGHNWVLLTQGTVINEFGQKAVQAKDNDYIPEGTDAVIAHTKMIGGGEEVTIEFEAPEAGEYEFICSFPGHYSVMKGKFIVEE
ncbi:azurin [Salegentibacter sp. JZCK2]|uniref:azurin n=1 Tax=Salegentibacter tibetensis TaxID=2873600 RepID=UPI001CCFCC27|nr:azurin [Salegentibacter tibetensis]MBZ9730284.1 azurin [Salegentibacter tibetensis]